MPLSRVSHEGSEEFRPNRCYAKDGLEILSGSSIKTLRFFELRSNLEVPRETICLGLLLRVFALGKAHLRIPLEGKARVLRSEVRWAGDCEIVLVPKPLSITPMDTDECFGWDIRLSVALFSQPLESGKRPRGKDQFPFEFSPGPLKPFSNSLKLKGCHLDWSPRKGDWHSKDREAEKQISKSLGLV